MIFSPYTLGNKEISIEVLITVNQKARLRFFKRPKGEQIGSDGPCCKAKRRSVSFPPSLGSAIEPNLIPRGISP